MVVLDKNNFEEEVLKQEGLVVVDFWSESCEPCKALLPEVLELSEKYSDNLKFCKLDITKARRLAIGQKVLGVPTIAIYKDGQKIGELVKEEVTRNSIEEMINKHI